MLTLRVIFTILSAICLAALIPVGAFLGLEWALILLFGAGLFFALMHLCKSKQEQRERAQKQAENPEPDFLHPLDKEKKN